MTMRCDYCRGRFGLIVHRYWYMRFCSAACARAYQERLHEETKAKIQRLERTVAEKSLPLGARLVADVTWHFAG